MTAAGIAVTFDAWTATAAEALRAADAHPDALALYHAARETQEARDECMSLGGGPLVLQYIARCLAVGLMPPGWLTDALIQRRSYVADGNSLSWDAPQAFGRHFPANTHLATVQKERRLKARVHDEVGRFFDQDPNTSICRDLFERIGEQLGFHVSGATAERLYYKAVNEGALNYAQIRLAERST